MAKFGHYFGLCSLIDHRALLGISEDSENGNVLVTLGKNIAMKYGVMDQNQEFSWITKEKFSSPVIYDSKTQKYVAVFNHLFIRCWEPETPKLDNLKKFKFKSSVNTIVVIDTVSFVIFEAGDIVTLEHALENHKILAAEQILNKNEYIADKITCYTDSDKYIALVVGNMDSNSITHLLWTSFDFMGNKLEYSRVSLTSEYDLAGCCFHLSNRQIHLLTLWSDGKLYMKSIKDNSNDLGKILYTFNTVACTSPVSMISLDEDYLALYGGNSNQEGALLLIYNMEFKKIQCVQPFKLQTIGAKLCKIQDKLFLPVGQTLAVVPYNLEKALLSTLIKSQCANPKDEVEIEESCWIGCSDVEMEKSELDFILKDYLEKGCTESMIFKDLLPVLIENTNLRDIKLLLKDFSIIEEDCHYKIMKYILELPRKKFKGSKQVLNEHYHKDLQPLERYEILKLVLEKPFMQNRNSLFGTLELDDIVKLFNFILYVLKYDENTCDTKFCMKLNEWANFILAANFQVVFSSKDENLLDVLAEFRDLTICPSSPIDCMFFKEQIVKKKKATKMADCEYTVETIHL